MNKEKYLPCFLPVRAVIFFLIFITGAFVTGQELRAVGNWWSTAASVVNIVTILLLVLLAKGTGKSYGELINYKKEKRSLKTLILIPLGIVIIGMSGMYLAGFICYGAMFPGVSLEVIAPVPPVLAVINMIALPLTVPFAEDGLYLGCGVNGIKNKYAAILVPAFFYAFQHCFIPTFFDARYMLYRFLSFLPLTIILCWYYYKKRDPVPIMIGHAALDVATAAMILMTSVIPGFYEEMCSMAMAQ